MSVTVTRLSEREMSAVLVVATVVVALAWSSTGVQGANRILTAGVAGAVAAVAMTGALAVLE